jgi:uncharacterized protein (TIGR02594 family)
MTITAYDVAQRFIGVHETPGVASDPLVLSMLRLEQPDAADDAIPWCSAFVNFVAWLLRLPRSKSLAARSWLSVGLPIELSDAVPGFDVVILKRGAGEQPGADVLDFPGHVGFFAGAKGGTVYVLGGNQGDAVSIEPFPTARILGVRRLAGLT